VGPSRGGGCSHHVDTRGADVAEQQAGAGPQGVSGSLIPESHGSLEGVQQPSAAAHSRMPSGLHDRPWAATAVASSGWSQDMPAAPSTPATGSSSGSSSSTGLGLDPSPGWGSWQERGGSSVEWMERMEWSPGHSPAHPGTSCQRMLHHLACLACVMQHQRCRLMLDIRQTRLGSCHEHLRGTIPNELASFGASDDTSHTYHECQTCQSKLGQGVVGHCPASWQAVQ
jgi:hypothetical protein